MKISQFRLVLVCVLLTVGLGIVGAQDSNYEALTAADVLHADYQDVEIHSADAFAILGLLMGIPELPVDDSLWATYFYSSESLDAEMRQIGLTGFRPHPYSDEATLIYEFQGQMECYTDGDGNPIPGDQFYVDFGASRPEFSLDDFVILSVRFDHTDSDGRVFFTADGYFRFSSGAYYDITADGIVEQPRATPPEYQSEPEPPRRAEREVSANSSENAESDGRGWFLENLKWGLIAAAIWAVWFIWVEFQIN